MADKRPHVNAIMVNMNQLTPFHDDEVKNVFNEYPPHIKNKMLYLRQIIFDVADGLSVVGKIEETLKWGEPAYLTSESKSGGTIRMD